MRKSILSKAALALSVSATMAISLSAQAQGTAPKCSTAQLVVPWGAGGDTDIVFRVYVDAINKSGIKPQLLSRPQLKWSLMLKRIQSKSPQA
jgi:tripartite-type tricarboxylate transporter receptor subunit TctC